MKNRRNKGKIDILRKHKHELSFPGLE